MATTSIAASKFAENQTESDILTQVLAELVAIRAMFGGAVYYAFETYDAGSIADGDEEVGELTVTGAALGDFCLVSHGVDVADLAVTGQVTAADTVTYQLNNNTGGAIDLASATVRCLVFKKPVVPTDSLALAAI